MARYEGEKVEREKLKRPEKKKKIYMYNNLVTTRSITRAHTCESYIENKNIFVWNFCLFVRCDAYRS